MYILPFVLPNCCARVVAQGASWEKRQKRVWEEIEEDQDGVLVVNTEEEELENFRRRRAKASDVVNQANIRKGLIRWLHHPESLPCSQ